MPSLLKSLELQGYKTFANRTLFEFAGTITAIVGPNGSGKSNIADSLRWVLGEQSYSLLRGKKTEDMIFSGSESRPRAGMASATITFDNGSGWLPIDFNEVAITRRAYRDGQNEYLINGQRVRLKDVAELLAQSGLAERTYTVIGQGLVDAALSLKAEERRRLFEEAAGIGLYRSRREDALRRLEVTRRNLERVQDILAELQPRLRSLERQARRVQEYEQVQADLRVMLREWYGYHWHRAQQDLMQAQDTARSQEGKLDIVRQEQAGLDQQLAGLRERLQVLRASLNSWHRQSAQLHTQRETLGRELAVADERTRSLAEQDKRIQAELVGLHEEIGLHQEQLHEAQGETERLSAELEEARSQADAARRTLAERQAQRGAAEKTVQTVRQEQGRLNAQQGELQTRLSERQAQVEKARRGLDTADEAVARAEGEHKAAGERLSASRQSEQQAEQTRQTAEDVLLQHRQRLAQVEGLRKQALDDRSAAQSELARLKAQLDVLEQAEAALTGYASGTRILLKAARQERLAARGALSSFLVVPAVYETAVSAALGEYLEAVLLDEDGEGALDLLEQEPGRGSMLPLAHLKPSTPLILPQQDGLLGLASDLVDAPPELRPAVDLLLGQVMIVQDRRAARRVLGNMAEHFPAARAVTLRGDVFHVSGPIQTVGGGRAETQTVLSRARQQRELKASLGEAQARLDALQQHLKELEQDLAQVQAEGQRLEETLRQARREHDSAALASNQANLVLEQAGKQLRWQQEQRQRLQGEMAHSEAEISELSKRLAGLESQLTQARERLRQANMQFAGLALDEFQSQVAHWNTQSALAEQALTGAGARQQEWQARLDRLQRSRSQAQTRLQETAASLATLDSEKELLRRSEAELAEKIRAMQVLISPAEVELDGVEQEQAGLQKAESAARQSLSLAEHQHAQARIALARRQEALETLRQRIEDDLGLVAFEYVDQVSGPTPLPLDGMVEQLPRVNQLTSDLEEMIKRQRAQLKRMGAINPDAQAEFQEVKQRFEFMTEQVADLRRAEEDVRQVITELDDLMQRDFRKTFDAVAGEFRQIFTRLFGGGSARLILTDPEDLTVTGIDIEARLPGRRSQGLSLLSGGERSLTAAALVFALLRVSPTPFCVLDEVDAMLDEMNVGRFRDLLRELSENTQFVIVTHNRNTVQVADVIYGITMGRDSASQILSLRLDELSQVFEN